MKKIEKLEISEVNNFYMLLTKAKLTYKMRDYI